MSVPCDKFFRLIAAFGVAICITLTASAAERSWIRVNQVGYLPGDPKIALVSSDVPLAGPFTIANLTADVGGKASTGEFTDAIIRCL